MIEDALTQQVASILAPALPYLIHKPADDSKKAEEIAISKLGEKEWYKAKDIWDILKSEVEKKSGTISVFEEVAKTAGDERLWVTLSHQLKGILEGMPIETINEIRTNISEEKSGTSKNTVGKGSNSISGRFTRDKELLCLGPRLPGHDCLPLPNYYYCRQCDTYIPSYSLGWEGTTPLCKKCGCTVERQK